MGVVYDASTTDGRPVALKTLRVEEDDPRNRMLVSRFLREARLLQRIDHRGIVRIIDVGFADGFVYLALERIDGVSLRAIHELQPLPIGALVWLACELADAIGHFHRAGIVHRDIKPSNVLIDTEGMPRLIDFGIATYLGATNITNQNAVLGTLGFVAPEVLEGKASPQSDQYSLGRMLISLASPFPRTEREIKSRERRILDGLHIEWSRFPDGGRWPILQYILQRMVADAPERRYDGMPSCAKVLRALARSVSPEDEARAIMRGLVREVKAKATPRWGERGVETAVLPRSRSRVEGNA
jgi:serine/threonine protein kinase